MVAEELKVVVRAEVDKAIRDMQKLDSTLGNTGESAKGMGMKMAAIGAAVGVAVVAVRKAVQVAGELISAYRVQEQAEARLTAVIKATGSAAGFTADELIKQASALQEVTTFGDEAIIGMQSILATFKSIQGPAFERTTELALDLSAAFGQDLKSSAIQLGKALEDPATGLTALRRIGVSFTDEQENMIKAMMEAGDAAGAQAEILRTLEGQVGGVARAMADTATGSMDQFKNKMGDLKEAIGQTLSQAVRPLVDALTDLVGKMIESVNTARQLRQGEREYAQGLETVLAYEAEMRDIEAQINAIGNRGGVLAERRVLLEKRRSELAQLIYYAELEQKILADNQIKQQEEMTRLAKEEEEARRRQLQTEQEYADAYANVKGILESAKTESERIRENIEYLEGFKWADGSMLEADRLSALRVLRERLDELADSTENLNDSLEKFVKMKDKLLNKAAFKTPPVLPSFGGDITTGGFQPGNFDMGGAQLAGAAVAAQVAVANLSTTIGRDFTPTVNLASRGVEDWVHVMEDGQAATEMSTDEIKELKRHLEDMSAAARQMGITFANTVAQAFADAMSGQAGAAIRGLIVGIVDMAAPGLGQLAGAAFDIISAMFQPLVDEFNKKIDAAADEARDFIDDLDEQFQDELDIRREFNDRLMRELDVEFEVIRDLWERNIISTDEFIDRMGDVNDSIDEAGDAADAASAEAAYTAWEAKVDAIQDEIDRLTAEFWDLSWWEKLGSADDEIAAAIEELQDELDELNRNQPDNPNRKNVFDGWGSQNTHTPAVTSPSYNVNVTVSGPVYGVDELGVQVHNAIQTAKTRGLI